MEALTARLDSVVDKYSISGYMPVSWQMRIDEDEEDENGPDQNFTKERSLRFVLINGARDTSLDAGAKFVTSGHRGDVFICFNTTHGNNIAFGMSAEVKKAQSKGGTVQCSLRADSLSAGMRLLAQ